MDTMVGARAEVETGRAAARSTAGRVGPNAGRVEVVLAPTVYEARLADLLARVSSGEVSPGDAARELRDLPFSDLGFAKVDHHRELRQGACEIVYAEGKAPGEVHAIVERLLTGNDGPILVSRASGEHVDAVRAAAAGAAVEIVERPRARCVALRRNAPLRTGTVPIVTAGTSDLGVAEEAELTASMLGARTEIVADVGVAGLHRLAAMQPLLATADAIVVVAGMEGALASVVGGIAACPVIACPTSVGYGASLGGLAALLSMLSSCAPGVACVNVDDGVGAGTIAAMIARQSTPR
jgi:pyridinium-3,5-biscarboxylic acid mononucleotide synthase